MKERSDCTEDSKKSSSNKLEKEGTKNTSSSSSSTVEGNEKKAIPCGSVRQYNRSKMPRLRWTPDLHLCFLHAVERLGGQDRATPKLVLQLMNIKGLSIAHVKSHLQMYRSKKMEDPNQDVNSQMFFNEGRDQHIYNLSQLPILQSFNQRPPSNLRYGDTSWTTHGNQIYSLYAFGTEYNHKTKHGFCGSLAERIFGRDIHMGNSSSSSSSLFGQSSRRTRQMQEEIFGRSSLSRPVLVDFSNPITQTRDTGNDQSNMNCSSNFSSSDCENRKVIKEGQSAIKRKALDLDLSISLLPKGDINQAGKNKIDSSLSLSLCPPSSSELNKMTEGDGNRKRARTTSSGLDLTL